MGTLKPSPVYGLFYVDIRRVSSLFAYGSFSWGNPKTVAHMLWVMICGHTSPIWIILRSIISGHTLCRPGFGLLYFFVADPKTSIILYRLSCVDISRVGGVVAYRSFLGGKPLNRLTYLVDRGQPSNVGNDLPVLTVNYF